MHTRVHTHTAQHLPIFTHSLLQPSSQARLPQRPEARGRGSCAQELSHVWLWRPSLGLRLPPPSVGIPCLTPPPGLPSRGEDSQKLPRGEPAGSHPEGPGQPLWPPQSEGPAPGACELRQPDAAQAAARENRGGSCSSEMWQIIKRTLHLDVTVQRPDRGVSPLTQTRMASGHRDAELGKKWRHWALGHPRPQLFPPPRTHTHRLLQGGSEIHEREAGSHES